MLVSCFATSIPRIQRVADIARERGRSVAFVGRRMADNAEVAMDLGLLRIPPSTLLSAGAAAELHPGRVGLPSSPAARASRFSALSLIGVGEHRDVAAGPGDTVVLSARVIPGNERDGLAPDRATCSAAAATSCTPASARVHVSGHGSQDDLVELLHR